MDKNLWIIANWKSNKTLQEALEWVEEVGSKLERRENLKVVVCPTFDCLAEVKKTIQVGNFPLLVGSQDLSPFDLGAYTGEEPASLLKQYVDVAILGHSERRQHFSETDQMVVEKVEQAHGHQIVPLVCVQSKDTPVSADCNLIAYEPVFAIGTGHPDTPADAEEVASAYKEKRAELEILYGGSVNHENAKAFLEQEHINGLLVGKASLDATEFLKIIEVCIGY